MKQTLTEFTSTNTDIFRQLLPNNTGFFQSSYQTIPALQERFQYQTVRHVLDSKRNSEFIPKNTAILGELITINTSNQLVPVSSELISRTLTLSECYQQTIPTFSEFFSFNIYWHYQRVTIKKYRPLQSVFKTILTISQQRANNNRGIATGGKPWPPTSIFKLNKFHKFQFQASGILLFTDVQKLCRPEISQYLPCML